MWSSGHLGGSEGQVPPNCALSTQTEPPLLIGGLAFAGAVNGTQQWVLAQLPNGGVPFGSSG
jgi:hypothetical protein